MARGLQSQSIPCEVSAADGGLRRALQQGRGMAPQIAGTFLGTFWAVCGMSRGRTQRFVVPYSWVALLPFPSSSPPPALFDRP